MQRLGPHLLMEVLQRTALQVTFVGVTPGASSVQPLELTVWPASEDPDALTHAWSARELHHRHIQAIRDAGTVEDHFHFIARDHLPAVGLDALLAHARATGEPLEVAPLLHIVRGALLGLSHAHLLRASDGTDRRRAHGHITAASVRVHVDGRTLLADFERGAPPGSFHPEPDVHALGRLLHEALALHRTRAAPAGAMDMLSRVLARPDHEPLEDCCPSLPKALARDVERMVSPDANDRFRTALDAANALEAQLRVLHPEMDDLRLAAWLEQLLPDRVAEVRERMARLHAAARELPVSSAPPLRELPLLPRALPSGSHAHSPSALSGASVSVPVVRPETGLPPLAHRYALMAAVAAAAAAALHFLR